MSLHTDRKMAPPVYRRPPAYNHKPPQKKVGTNGKGNDDGYLYVAGVRDPSKRVIEYRTDQDECPLCHTDRQFNKNLRLLVSPCYHKMCEACIDRLFTLGPEPCPNCGRILRKINFAHQTFEDLKVEKEVSVRRRMADIFNKRRGDFESDRKYDDYLELVEDLTFNLLNDVDVPKTEARIVEWQRQNASTIEANKQKSAEETMSQSKREEVERRAREERVRMIEEFERIEKMEEERIRAERTEALARGDTRTVRGIERQAARAKEMRRKVLDHSIPPSLLATLQPSDVQHSPLSPSYNGPYVPIPYSNPDNAPWAEWYEVRGDYVDRRAGVLAVKEDKDGKFRGGAFDLRQFWEMEVRSAVEAVGVEPLM